MHAWFALEGSGVIATAPSSVNGPLNEPRISLMRTRTAFVTGQLRDRAIRTSRSHLSIATSGTQRTPATSPLGRG